MGIIKELLVDELQHLLYTENQLVEALPKMAEAARHPKLKEGILKHLEQTRDQVQRLHQVFELLDQAPEQKECRTIDALIQDGRRVIEDGRDKDALPADLALIAAAQRVEHYEIAGYGTARDLARQIRVFAAATLLSRSLGEEEAADHLLTEIAKPILQEATVEDLESEEISA